jgi:ferredoxin-NADP reductase
MNKVKILMAEFVTHDVQRFVVEKPEGYEYKPGQATDVAIDEKGWREEKRPFTFTSLPGDEVLEFTIKGYPVKQNPDHDGMTEKLHSLESGDYLLIDQPWGTIHYKGPGVFIAGGAGVTPFVAMLRDLTQRQEIAGNTLLYSNKGRKDIILEKEFRDMLGDKAVFTLTQEKRHGYERGRIDADFIARFADDFRQHFYVCGPPPMVNAVKNYLTEFGVKPESVVFEE